MINFYNKVFYSLLSIFQFLFLNFINFTHYKVKCIKYRKTWISYREIVYNVYKFFIFHTIIIIDFSCAINIQYFTIEIRFAYLRRSKSEILFALQTRDSSNRVEQHEAVDRYEYFVNGNFVQISSWWVNRTNWAVRLIHDPQTEFNTTVKAVDSLFLILTVAPLWSLEPRLKTTVFGISISVVLSLVQLNYKSGCYLRWNYFDLLKEFSS